MTILKPLHILIDYSNILSCHKDLGMQNLIDLILSKVDFSFYESIKNINIRIYGGWYEQNILTRQAQKIITDIDEINPYIYQSNSSTENKIIVNVQLAYSLLADPERHLFYTYRYRSNYYGLKVQTQKEFGCLEENCPLLVIEEILRTEKCPVCDRKNMQNAFYRGEQKLIDTMLTSDLILLSISKENIVIVTSDDDFWPGIFTSVSLGAKMTHIKTKNIISEYDDSTRLLNNYSQNNLNSND